MAVRKRRTSEKTRENHNNEPMKLMKAGMENEAARGSVAPSGRTGFLAGFPGNSSLANLRCRFATPNRDLEVGKGGTRTPGGGKRRYRTAFSSRMRSVFPASSQHFPAFPTFSHINFFREQKYSREPEGGLLREKLRIFTRSFTKVRESSHRSGPWLRDCSDFYG